MAKLRASAKLLDNVRLVAEDDRGHSVICDLPKASGGTSAGPTPLELCLMPLEGCWVITYADVCKNSKTDLGNIKITVEAEKSTNESTLTKVIMKVNIAPKQKSSSGSCLGRMEANCPVMVVFKESVPVKVQTEIKTD
jgi:uncharacterized OsmC-like protein